MGNINGFTLRHQTWWYSRLFIGGFNWKIHRSKSRVSVMGRTSTCGIRQVRGVSSRKLETRWISWAGDLDSEKCTLIFPSVLFQSLGALKELTPNIPTYSDRKKVQRTLAVTLATWISGCLILPCPQLSSHTICKSTGLAWRANVPAPQGVQQSNPPGIRTITNVRCSTTGIAIPRERMEGCYCPLLRLFQHA